MRGRWVDEDLRCVDGWVLCVHVVGWKKLDGVSAREFRKGKGWGGLRVRAIGLQNSEAAHFQSGPGTFPAGRQLKKGRTRRV